MHIDDACESFRCCIESNLNTNNLVILNIGNNDDNYRIIDIAKLIHSNVEGSRLNYIDS